MKERSTLLYTGTGSNLVYSEVEMNSDEVRQADLARLYGQFRTADGQYFEATVSQSELPTSPEGKTLVTFWAKVPAALDTAGLQLYISQAIADGKLTAAGTAATGYVNTAALTLTPAEVTPLTNLASVSLFPYTLAVTSSTGELTKGASSIAVTFNYNLNQDTTYQTGAYQHKLILQVIDPYGQSHEKALMLGTDLTLGTNNSYSTTLTSALFKNLSSGTYALKFYDEFQEYGQSSPARPIPLRLPPKQPPLPRRSCTMNKKKIIIIASAIVLVAIAGIAGYKLWPDQNRQINAAPLNTAVASKGDILVGVSGSGAVSAINSESIRTKEAGKVDTVMVKKGDVVKKGAVLITFVAGDLDDKLKEATKSLENLKTELANKQESYKTLAMNNATEEELESAKKPLIRPIAIS